MASNLPMRGRVQRAEAMDDEAYARSLYEQERRDHLLAIQLFRHPELAVGQLEGGMEFRDRRQQEREDERIARDLDAQEQGLAGAEEWDRAVAERLAREEGGDNDVNFGAHGGAHQHDHHRDHGHDHDHDHGHQHNHHHHHHEHDFGPAEDDGEPLFVAEVGQDDDPMAEHDNETTGRGFRAVAVATCTGCGDRHHRFLRTTCDHAYCVDCLAHLFRSSMTDEALFPPRCCGNEMPLDEVRPLLGVELAREFAAKSVELSTADRTYCHDQRCSTFIPPATIQGEVGVCPTCARSTCSICKGISHQGDCPQDPGVQAVIDLAQGEGWRRCDGCRRMIESNYGCNHMTCVCGYQFCYVCGARWRTCRCPQWQEDRLLNRAAHLVDRQRVPPAAAAAAPPPAPPPRWNPIDLFANPFAPVRPRPVPAAPDARLQALRDDRIQQMAARLQENANCAHPLNWMATTVDRRAQCELCGRVKNKVYSCRWCGITACYACRRNRLR